MVFGGHMRPGQGFRYFRVLRRVPTVTDAGRPVTSGYALKGGFLGLLIGTSPEETERWRQLGTPVSHMILQRRTAERAKANDILELTISDTGTVRHFLVQGQPTDSGEMGHLLLYRVLEREDLP